MADVEIKFDDRKLIAALRKVPGALHDEMTKAFNRSMVEFQVAMESRFDGSSSPPWWGNSGDNLVSRTGNLARSLGFQVSKGARIGELRGVSFIGDANTPYASIQESGGTVTGSPWLTVPLPDNKTASGVTRFQSAAALKRDPTVKTWIQRSRAGNLIIRAEFPGKPIQNLWILKSSVFIKPRMRFGRTFEDQRQAQIKNVNRAATRALKTATKGAS